MTYSGKRIPRDNDSEKWKIFFKANPKRKKEFKEKWLELNPPKKRKSKKIKKIELPITEIIEAKKTLISPKEERTLNNLVGCVFWSNLLGASVTITRVDLDRNIINVRIVKSATMSIADFANMPMDHYGTDINNNLGMKASNKKNIDDWDTDSIAAFRQFKDFLGQDKATPMEEWVKKNLK